MNVRTLLRYLFLGDADAIRTIANSRSALWMGLVFVFSAALAREYDVEYLPAKWWLLFVPLLASLAMTFLLFWLLWWRRDRNYASRLSRRSAFRSLLTLFWMTAPLAWLYAIPYERYFSAPIAMQLNIVTLLIVAIWRIILICRTIPFINGARRLETTLLVLLVSDVVMFVALGFAPIPIVPFMSGVHVSAEAVVLNDAAKFLAVLGEIALPILAISARLAAGPAVRQTASSIVSDDGVHSRASAGIIALAAASILFWLPFLPATQREQWLRIEAERMLRSNVGAGLTFISGHRREEFPPNWDPPPRGGYPDVLRLKDVMDLIDTGFPVAPWVKEIYEAKRAWQSDPRGTLLG